MLWLTLTLFITSLATVRCWSQAELDLFDLVEEIGDNFYDVLQVTQVQQYTARILINIDIIVACRGSRYTSSLSEAVPTVPPRQEPRP